MPLATQGTCGFPDNAYHSVSKVFVFVTEISEAMI